jgi:hypothetical protein
MVHFILFVALFNRLKKAVNVWAITFPFFYFANSVLFASNRDSFSLSFVLFLFLFFAAWFGSRTFFYAGFIMHEAFYDVFNKHCAGEPTAAATVAKSEIETKFFRPLIRFPLSLASGKLRYG